MTFENKNRLLEENYDSGKHGYLKAWCDAFGEKVQPPDGYYLLRNDSEVNDKIQPGDIHFDIYAGWTNGHSAWNDGHYVSSEGRWRAWARKITR